MHGIKAIFASYFAYSAEHIDKPMIQWGQKQNNGFGKFVTAAFKDYEKQDTELAESLSKPDKK